MTILKICFVMFAAVFFCSCGKTDDTYRKSNPQTLTYDGTVYDYIFQQNSYDSLRKILLRLPAIANTLQNSVISMMAIKNESFALALDNINKARKDSVPVMPAIDYASIDAKVLDTIISKYIIPDSLVTTTALGVNLIDGVTYHTLKYGYEMQLKYYATNASGYKNGGPKIILFSDKRKSIFSRYWVTTQTTTVDLKAKNGMIHILTEGHDFGFGVDFVRSVNRR